jgi:hypothetical protein
MLFALCAFAGHVEPSIRLQMVALSAAAAIA